MKPLPEELRRPILENPGDDLRRQIAADWLEENGETNRAEFVRVQLEFAGSKDCLVSGRKGTRPCWEAFPEPHAGKGRDPYCKACRVLVRLKKREHELLERHAADWDELRFAAGFGCTFRRGFVAEVRCTIPNWSNHEVAVVRIQPVQHVDLAGVEPILDGDRALFEFTAILAAPHHLPMEWESEFGDYTHGSDRVYWHALNDGLLHRWQDAVSFLALTRARKQAGLPPGRARPSN